MAWPVELDRAALRDLDKLSHQPARCILSFLRDRVAVRIADAAVRVLVLKIGHRRSVYR